jgi:hypothetical protein
MIAKEIATKGAQFEYELDFRGVQTHSPDLVQASKLRRIVLASKQAPQICASKLHR